MADSEELDCSGSPNETDDIENRLVNEYRYFLKNIPPIMPLWHFFIG